MPLNPLTIKLLDDLANTQAAQSDVVRECIARYATPQGCCDTLRWIIFRIVNAVKAAFSCFGCCASEWQRTLNILRDSGGRSNAVEVLMRGFLEVENTARSKGWTDIDLQNRNVLREVEKIYIPYVIAYSHLP